MNFPGYQFKQININGSFILFICKNGVDKPICTIQTLPNIRVSQQEFNLQLEKTIKEQIEAYEKGE